MAALLSGDMPDRNFKKKDSLVEHLRRLPADGDRSGAAGREPFASPNSRSSRRAKIAFGLAAIKGCGGSAAARHRRGAAQRRADSQLVRLLRAASIRRACNRAAIESLIKAGAFDRSAARRSAADGRRSIGPCKPAPSALADRRSRPKGIVRRSSKTKPTPAPATASLPDMPEWDERQKLANEKEVLGFYLTSHPLAEHAANASRPTARTRPSATADASASHAK